MLTTPAKPKATNESPAKKPAPLFANKEQFRQYCRTQFSETPPHVDDLSRVLQNMPADFIEFILQQKRKEETLQAPTGNFVQQDHGAFSISKEDIDKINRIEDPKTEIGKRLDSLDITANDLSCVLDHLESRISSVLLPGVPQPVNGVGAQAPGPIRSEVEISIDSTLFSLHRSIDRIREIMGRVQL